MLYEIQSEEPLTILLKTFREVGGVIDYVLIGGIFPERDLSSSACHTECAIFTIETACARYRSQDKGPESRRESGKIQGEHVDPADFFAPGYLWIPTDEIEAFPYFSQEEKAFYQADRNVRLHQGIGYGFHNYHHAFCYTPYGLARYGKDIQELSGQEQNSSFLISIRNCLVIKEKH